MNRLLIGNGLNPATTKILDVITSGQNSIVIVESDGVKYKLDGFNKTIIEDKKDEVVEIEVVNEPKNETVTKNDVKKPRGWHFRPVYVDSEGTVYHKGVEQPDLKGTLPISEN